MMGKLAGIVGAIGLLIVAGVWYFVSFRLDDMLHSEIEKTATVALGSRVEVSGVETNLRDGSLRIGELSVANPAGFDNPYAMRFRGVEAAVDYPSREIKRIIIDNPQFLIEEKDGKLNFAQMLQALKSGAAAAESAGSNADQPVITIRHFRINETRAAFESQTYDRQTSLKVAAIEMNDLHGTPAEIARLVATEVVGELKSEASRELLKVKARKKFGDVESKVSRKLRQFLDSDRDAATTETDTGTGTGTGTQADADLDPNPNSNPGPDSNPEDTP